MNGFLRTMRPYDLESNLLPMKPVVQRKRPYETYSRRARTVTWREDRKVKRERERKKISTYTNYTFSETGREREIKVLKYLT